MTNEEFIQLCDAFEQDPSPRNLVALRSAIEAGADQHTSKWQWVVFLVRNAHAVLVAYAMLDAAP